MAPNFVVDIDGCYWHGCKIHCPNDGKPNQAEKDFKANQDALAAGYTPLRILEHDLVPVKTKKPTPQY